LLQGAQSKPKADVKAARLAKADAHAARRDLSKLKSIQQSGDALGTMPTCGSVLEAKMETGAPLRLRMLQNTAIRWKAFVSERAFGKWAMQLRYSKVKRELEASLEEQLTLHKEEADETIGELKEVLRGQQPILVEQALQIEQLTDQLALKDGEIQLAAKKAKAQGRAIIALEESFDDIEASSQREGKLQLELVAAWQQARKWRRPAAIIMRHALLSSLVLPHLRAGIGLWAKRWREAQYGHEIDTIASFLGAPELSHSLAHPGPPPATMATGESLELPLDEQDLRLEERRVLNALGELAAQKRLNGQLMLQLDQERAQAKDRVQALQWRCQELEVMGAEQRHRLQVLNDADADYAMVIGRAAQREIKGKQGAALRQIRLVLQGLWRSLLRRMVQHWSSQAVRAGSFLAVTRGAQRRSKANKEQP